MNLSNALLRQFSPRNRHPGNVTLLTNYRFYGKYRGYSKKIGFWFKENSIEVAKACTKQLEFIAAQRIRRSLQLFELYTKIWDEVALKEFLKTWRRKIRKNAKDFVVSSVGLTAFNWEKNRINEEELYSYVNEIDSIHELKSNTVVCSNCHSRLIIDKELSNINYCTCQGKYGFVTVRDDSDWQPFIERKDMLIWRREEPNSGGLFAYKVFGTFSDVSADEFLRVQVDVEYRKEWDPTAKKLEIIDSDPKFISTDNQRSDVIYWEMIWPRLFSNRDYVYQRRWVVDKEKGIVIIVSRFTDHPNAPDRPDTYRVTSYWSYMVIKPCQDFDQPGIEFGLTYFEDPGVNIPSAIRSWIAISGFPDFLDKMRQAAKDYKRYVARKDQVETISLLEEKVVKTEEESNDIHSNNLTIEKKELNEIELSLINQEDIRINENNNDAIEENVNNVEVVSSAGDELKEQTVEKQNGYLRYLFLTKLFA